MVFIISYILESTLTFKLQKSPKGNTVQFSSVQFSYSVVSDSLRPHGPQHTRPPITNSQSLLKLMSIESVMPSNHLILCCPLLLPTSIFPSIREYSESINPLSHPRQPRQPFCCVQPQRYARHAFLCFCNEIFVSLTLYYFSSQNKCICTFQYVCTHTEKHTGNTTDWKVLRPKQ